jgi:predicted TIM-barrel fold metal-dependent hydrolase
MRDSKLTTNKMKIDSHHHIEPDPDYIDRLDEICARRGIDRVCLLGLPEWLWGGSAVNGRVQAAFTKYPNRFIGFAFIQLGEDPPERVSEYHGRGFQGLKLDFPHAAYDDPRFFPIYEQAARLGMTLYFHTGITARLPEMGHRYISSSFMRPATMDAIAPYFPELNIVMAHMGNPWLDEAAMLLRIHPNLYSDLTGSTMKYRPAARLREVLWWQPGSPYGDKQNRHAFEKIVFGSDLHYNDYDDILRDYQNVLDGLALPENVRAPIWDGTMVRLLEKL